MVRSVTQPSDSVRPYLRANITRAAESSVRLAELSVDEGVIDAILVPTPFSLQRS
jgi:hypothetical protein